MNFPAKTNVMSSRISMMKFLSGGEMMKSSLVAKGSLSLVGLMVGVLWGTQPLPANAEGVRVLVKMKNPETFSESKRGFLKKTELSAKGQRFGFKLPETSLANIEVKMEASLENLNSLVLSDVSESEMNMLQKNSDVLFVDREVIHPLLDPRMRIRSNGSDLVPSLGTTMGDKTPWGIFAVKAIEAWTNSSSGLGSRVLVLDTGIDANHPSLKANFELGKNFLNDPGQNNPTDYKDLVGHGTHCAGTIAGALDSTGFTGVAPKAKLLMGRVCSTRGCSNISIANGINWGISQKVDVISLSLGGNMSTPSERMAIASALKAGVTVVAASGNDGSEKVSYPAALPGVIAVGAVDSDLKKANFSQFGPELSIAAPGVNVVSTVPSGEGREAETRVSVGGVNRKVNSTTFGGSEEYVEAQISDVVYAGLGKPEDFAKINVKEKFVLVQRGEIKFVEKIQNAIEAGAKAVIIANNQPGLISGSLTEDNSSIGVGVFMIEQTVGEELKSALAKGTKVEVSLRTLITDYAAFSGTSMATPHVAGVVALVKAANKKLAPGQIKALLQRTATALGPNDKNQFGAGLINAEKAVNEALKI